MLIHESFIRCSECDSPYFKRVEYVTLNKLHFEQTPPSILEEDIYVEYVCLKCAHIVHKDKKTS